MRSQDEGQRVCHAAMPPARRRHHPQDALHEFIPLAVIPHAKQCSCVDECGPLDHHKKFPVAGRTKILPSPMRPVRAAVVIARTASSTRSSSTHSWISTFGRKASA